MGVPGSAHNRAGGSREVAAEHAPRPPANSVPGAAMLSRDVPSRQPVGTVAVTVASSCPVRPAKLVSDRRSVQIGCAAPSGPIAIPL